MLVSTPTLFCVGFWSGRVASCQRAEEGHQLRHFVLCDVPEFVGVNDPVAVGEQVAEAHDLAPRDIGVSLLPLLGQLGRGLADHKQLALDGRAFLVIRREGGEVHVACVPEDRVTGGDDVGQVEPDVTRHDAGQVESVPAGGVSDRWS